MSQCIHADYQPVTHWAYRPLTLTRANADVAGVCDSHAQIHKSKGYIVFPSSLRGKPGALAIPGDYILVDGTFARVTEVNTYPAYSPEANRSPIHSGMIVRAVTTQRGIRYFGHNPGERYQGIEISYFCQDGISFEK